MPKYALLYTSSSHLLLPIHSYIHALAKRVIHECCLGAVRDIKMTGAWSCWHRVFRAWRSKTLAGLPAPCPSLSLHTLHGNHLVLSEMHSCHAPPLFNSQSSHKTGVSSGCFEASTHCQTISVKGQMLNMFGFVDQDLCCQYSILSL